MSAWLVDKVHIDLLVELALRGPADAQRRGDWQPEYHAHPRVGERAEPDPDGLGRMLWGENLRSVAYRYPADEGGGRPGPAGLSDEAIAAYHFERPGYRLTVAEAMMALHCLDYQACECPDYQETPARRWLHETAFVLGMYAPGADDSPWGWDRAEIDKRRIAPISRLEWSRDG